MTWIPLSRRENDDNSDYLGPFEGVPEWLFGALWSWCVRRISMYDRGSLRSGAVTEYRALAMALRVSLDAPGSPATTDARPLQARLLDMVRVDENILLDAVDYFVRKIASEYAGRPASSLVSDCSRERRRRLLRWIA